MYEEIKINDKFGRLTVIGIGTPVKSGSAFICRCDCGNVKEIARCGLVTGHTKSCGCLQRERAAEAGRQSKTHGLRKTRLFKVWDGMNQRCYNPNNSHYKYYGAKGVTICDEWREFLNFYNWAMKAGYDPEAKRGDCTIDRIDPYGNYEPRNCRWVSMKVQNTNKRRKA